MKLHTKFSVEVKEIDFDFGEFKALNPGSNILNVRLRAQAPLLIDQLGIDNDTWLIKVAVSGGAPGGSYVFGAQIDTDDGLAELQLDTMNVSPLEVPEVVATGVTVEFDGGAAGHVQSDVVADGGTG